MSTFVISIYCYVFKKRQKMTSLRDVSLAEAGKYGSLNEFAFFDKVCIKQMEILFTIYFTQKGPKSAQKSRSL